VVKGWSEKRHDAKALPLVCEHASVCRGVTWRRACVMMNFILGVHGICRLKHDRLSRSPVTD
jgi:hypothetical protein